MSIQDMADYLVGKLKASKFTVQRYDAYTTKSIYLKLDYGVCHSIRISDHKGKANLHYRYNLLKNFRKQKGKKQQMFYFYENGYKRWYIPFDEVSLLVTNIRQERASIKQKYGKKNYWKFMKKNQAENQNKAGFWSKCYLC